MAHGEVFQSANIRQMAQDYPKKSSTSEDEAASEKKSCVSVCQDSELDTSDAGTVVFLHPPKAHLGWSVSRTFLKCKVWLLELCNPALDEGCKEKVITIQDLCIEIA
jgi:hypothetical protein